MTALARLRAFMKQHQLDAVIVPRADEFQNEYVAADAERLAWLSGFTGSAGLAIVLRDTAALFVDSRYTVQAPLEIDTQHWTVVPLEQERPSAWLGGRLDKGMTVAVDPWQVTQAQLSRFQEAAADGVNWHFIPHLIDTLWTDKPASEHRPPFRHPVAYAGIAAQEKIVRLQAALRAAGDDALLLSNPASVCWLLNIRGDDVPYTPLVLAYALIPAAGEVQVFYDAPLPEGLDNVTQHPRAALEPALASYSGRVVQLDKETASYALHQAVQSAGVRFRYDTDPCQVPKACKNAVEQQGTIAAHQRDGRALSQCLDWLRQVDPASITELDIADKLEALRRAQPLFHSLSFPTIAGSGANGAIVHYRATPARHRRLQEGDLLLLDSGAQYLDGTTDVTRTIFIGRGQPTPEQRRAYTLVLKGHIALASARFPKGTSGAQLDVLARQWLWQAGLDYGHGTGHGVGSFLSVHEGPQGISKRAHTPLQAGMILSNEPGYYLEGAFGIRLENLVLVQEDSEGWLFFRTLTLAPFDERLIDTEALTPSEATWLRDYAALVAANLK